MTGKAVPFILLGITALLVVILIAGRTEPEYAALAPRPTR